jgi:hypothetical protein
MKRTRILLSAAVAVMAVGLAGFGISFKQPLLPDGPRASLIVERSSSQGGMSVKVFLVEDAQCSRGFGGKGNGYIGIQNYVWKMKQPIEVLAGKPLYIKASGDSLTAGPGFAVAGHCTAVAAFTPEEGRSYAVRQSFRGTGCHLEVRDIETDAPPTSYEPLPAEGRCLR